MRIALVLVLASACGNNDVTCEPIECPTSTARYGLCMHVDGSVTYTIGGTSCSCGIGDTTGCRACQAALVTYCASDAGMPTCSATFSGAVQGAITPCSVTIVDDSTQSSWSLSSAGASIVGTPYAWAGVSVQLPSFAAIGSYALSSVIGASTVVGVDPGGDLAAASWSAGRSASKITGALTLALTELGPSTTNVTTTTYTAPHGSITATLVDPGAPSVTLAFQF